MARTRRNRLSLAAGLAVVALLVAGPLLAPHDPGQTDLRHRLAPPSATYPLGTDALGRCLLSRLLHGFHLTPLAGVAVVLLTATTGTACGLTAACMGGWVDQALMRLVEGTLVFPALAVALVLIGFTGPGLGPIVLALSAVHWTEYARLVHTTALAELQRQHIMAARALGAGNARLVLRHLLPGVAGPLLVLAAHSMAWAVLSFAGLSFLGLGAAPGSPEWGLMISEARAHMRTHPLLVAAPGLTITAIVLVFNHLGDALRDRLEPASP